MNENRSTTFTCSELEANEEFHCDCPPLPESEDLVSIPGCSDDRSAVGSLPDDWVPKHGGPILANYLKEQKQNHDKALEDLGKKAITVNTNVDSKIRALCETLLAHIKENEREISCVIENCNTWEGSLPTEQRNVALKRVHQLYTQRIEDLATFRRDALELEKQRTDNLRSLMRDQFQRLIAIGYKAPKDLLHDFDDRTYEINQQLLSNARAYSELEAQLSAQANQSVIKARSALNQLSLGVAMSSRGRSAHPQKPEARYLEKRSLSASERRCTDPSLGRIIGNVDEIDECVSRLLGAYRTAILKVFFSFFGKLNDLHHNLTDCNVCTQPEMHICDITELQDVIERASNLVSSSYINKKEFSAEITAHSDTISMRKSLWSIGEQLRDTYSILHDAGHFWDAHMIRLAYAQKLTLAAVEDLLTSNDLMEQTNEIAFNIAVEQLRVTSDQEKLQQRYDALVLMLDQTADIYMNHTLAEIERLKEFMNLPPLMASMLLAEFDLFFEKHPRVDLQSSNTLNLIGLSANLDDDYTHIVPVPRAVLQTELQEVALKNWRNGFLESFKTNVSFVPEELTRQARQWVEERSAILHMRYSLKLVSHSIRKERVKAASDARHEELAYHNARLNSHMDAIYDLVDGLPVEASEFLSVVAPELYPLCDWLDRMQSNMQELLSTVDLDPEVKKMKMVSYATRLLKYRGLFESSLETAVEDYKKQSEHRIQEARISNVRFMGQITLFSECGRYSEAEASKTCQTLLKGSEALENCKNRASDALNNRRVQLMAQADERMLPLQKVVDEFVKVRGKKGAAAPATKKAPINKKK